MSDNGGLSTAEGSPTSNLPLRGGKGWLYEGGIREPFLIRWPGVTKPGSVSEELVISTDFYPTILEIANLPLRPELHRDTWYEKVDAKFLQAKEGGPEPWRPQD